MEYERLVSWTPGRRNLMIRASPKLMYIKDQPIPRDENLYSMILLPHLRGAGVPFQPYNNSQCREDSACKR